jgi:mxaJ protein
VFVSRRGRAPRDFDDPVLATMRIGLQAVGAEGANVPPAGSLSARNLAGQVVGYPMWAAQEDAPAAASGTGWPPADAQARIVDAVAAGEIDTAVVWGPVGAYFAARHGKALDVTPTPTADARQPGVAFTIDVAIGVRKGDEALKARLQRALDERRAEVDAVLEQYHVPLVNPTKSGWPGHPEPGDAR